MSDSYGSGLSFGSATDAPPGIGNSPTITGPQPDAIPTDAPNPAPAGNAMPSFGSALRSILPGPNYTTPDPQASALDQSADLLEQRVKRANSIATNPLAQFFAPAQVQAARAFVPQATEQLQKIQQQKAAIQANHAEAETLGIAGEVSDQASHDDLVKIAQAKALKGNLKTWSGLAAVAPEKAAAIQDRVHEVVAGHLDKAQLAFDSLAGMQDQGQYRAKLNQLRQDGTLTDLEALGMKVPPTFDAFSASKGAEGKALREARIAMQTLGAKLEERSGGTPMEKKEAETYSGRLTTESGQPLNNVTWSRINGKRVAVANGMADITELGKKFTFASPDQRKAFHEDAKAAVPEKEIEKVRGLERIGVLATKDFNGKYIPPEGLVTAKGERIFMNTNPNVMQGVSEVFAAELREGMGGANSSLLNIEASKRGAVQGLLDKLKAAYAGGINGLSGEQIKPYLTQLTQEQQRQVLDGLREYSAKSISDRVAPIARRAGELGLDASALGLGKGEVKSVEDAIEAGRQSTIDRFKPRARATSGGDGGIYLDNPPPMLVTQPDNPNTQHPPLPAPVQRDTATPGANPPPTPAQVQPASPPGVLPGGGGTPPSAPVTIAGAQVSAPQLPPGASPTYAASTQRIESGNERDPWTAGTKNSSASGAFQMIDRTWNENKPAGAPVRAKDATPEQQTQALATLTAKNATSLQSAGLPVNDRNLYIAHNLGAGAGPALLKASPEADARTIVGEEAARNNPTFFKGRPTVATVLARYQEQVDANNPNKPAFNYNAGVRGTPEQRQQRLEEAQRANAAGNRVAVDYAPTIGSTVGAVAGGLSPVPGGAVVGGVAGGAAGQSFKDYMQGRPQSATEIVKQGVLGGILGVASEARPLLAAGTRVAGVAATEAGDAALKGDNLDAVDAGVKGLAYGLGGEALGRFVSSGGATAYKALSRYTTSAQHELSAQAGKLAEARAVLANEEPKLPGDAGANPKYEAAKKQADEATQAIKDHGQNPDDMVHAYEQAKAGTSAGEAAVLRGANSEKNAVSQGYNDLRQNVRDAGVGTPKSKPNQPVPNGPLAQLRTADNMAGKVPEQFRPEAEHAEMLIKALAKDWGEKWQQLQNAGTELIEKRMAFLSAGDKPSAKAMDNLFEGVRAQQKAAAEYVFGKEVGAKVISNLENLDKRWAGIMTATQGMNYEKMRSVLASGNTPERRELEKNFREFAKDDSSAIRAFNAMKAGARGDWKTEAALMTPIIASEVTGVLPTLGAVTALVGAHRLYKLMQGYVNAKTLGTAVTFAQFLGREVKGGVSRTVGDATRRGVVTQQ